MADYPTWINGVDASLLPVTDRGLAYGDGLFETVRVSSGQPTLIDLHMRRLKVGAGRLGIALESSVLNQEIERYLSHACHYDGILKLIVTRGSGGRGYNPQGCVNSTRILSFHDLPVYPDSPAVSGIRLFPCKTALGQSALAGLKHLNRLENVLARAEWQAESGCLEGLLLDYEGRLIEGTMSNLFFVQDQGLKTPSLHRSGVEGIARAFVLEQAEQLGLDIQIGDFTRMDLQQADEVFVCNSVNGVWPVVAFESMSWGLGAVTKEIRDRLLEVLNV